MSVENKVGNKKALNVDSVPNGEFMVDSVTEYKTLDCQVRTARERMNELRERIQGFMTNAGVTEMTAGPFRVRWSRTVHRAFDVRSFRAAHGELCEKYMVETPTRVFSVV